MPLDQNKPHRGRITDWHKESYLGGWRAVGRFGDGRHPRVSELGRTSKVVALDAARLEDGVHGCLVQEIETESSRYTLVGYATDDPRRELAVRVAAQHIPPDELLRFALARVTLLLREITDTESPDLVLIQARADATLAWIDGLEELGCLPRTSEPDGETASLSSSS